MDAREEAENWEPEHVARALYPIDEARKAHNECYDLFLQDARAALQRREDKIAILERELLTKAGKGLIESQERKIAELEKELDKLKLETDLRKEMKQMPKMPEEWKKNEIPFDKPCS